MSVIEEVTPKRAKKIVAEYIARETPGFSKKQAKAGLNTLPDVFASGFGTAHTVVEMDENSAFLALDLGHGDIAVYRRCASWDDDLGAVWWQE